MLNRTPSVGMLMALLALAAAAGCRQRPPDVVLVLVDTLRADRVGAAGGRSGLTPFLDSLAAGGVTFTNAYATSSWTNPSVASLFTSRYPSQTHVARYDSRLGAEEVTLAERLGAAGWRSVGMVGNFRLSAALGFGQGFDAWFPRLARVKPRAQRIARDTLAFYDEQLAPYPWSRWTRRPLLLYLHFMEPHAPYEPPAWARRGRVGPPPPGTSEAAANDILLRPGRWHELSAEQVAWLASLYDAEVAALDARLARLFRRLAGRGVLDHAVVVVTADHGEEFREHGGLQHGTALFQESVRIPLVMTGPGLPAGKVVHDPVALVDVAPTLLALLGLPAEPRFEGRSLLPLAGTPAAPADVLLELEPTGQRIDLRRHAAGLVHDDAKLLVPPHGAPTAYELRNDAGETRPDPPDLAAEAAALRARLSEWQRVLATRAAPSAETMPLDADTRERLRALGYAD